MSVKAEAGVTDQTVEVRVYELTREIGDCIAVRLSGRITLSDLQSLGTDLQPLVVGERQIRLMLQLQDFEGWGIEAVPPELRLDVKFGRQVQVLAVVGQAQWQRRMTDVMKALLRAEVHYFDAAAQQQAWYWLLAT